MRLTARPWTRLIGPLAALLACCTIAIAQEEKPVLRVCADPNNMPFSNRQGEGFENKLVELVADKLEANLHYTWQPQRRGFLRTTLYAGECDLVAGVPSSLELILATRPYYRSTYVFVQRADHRPRIESFDDPALRSMRVGVHLIGDDGNNSPPAHALTRRGLTSNLKGYMITGDYRQDSPPARLVEAVAQGDVDVAAVWGPLAGYFASRQERKLVMTPVSPSIDIPALPFIYSISMGVRLDDRELKAQVDQVLHQHRAEVQRILDDFGVPRR
ncbi:substrate-binding domain-containing protein [Gilvimarinus sp. F26214L]|uniref:substrate-binding domain-containing protein n=1 Tax=Gilvimarinus sp. DZF01 TaxID=3461371 RepID=UPI0040462B27